MASYYDRYSTVRTNGNVLPLPGIIIPESDSDKYVIYKKGLTRLDKVSDSYYNNPYSGWLILLANPQYGGLEFNIPDMTTIRVPFPFENGLVRYGNALEKYRTLYGGVDQ
jgi:hypothetical protein